VEPAPDERLGAKKGSYGNIRLLDLKQLIETVRERANEIPKVLRETNKKLKEHLKQGKRPRKKRVDDRDPIAKGKQSTACLQRVDHEQKPEN